MRSLLAAEFLKLRTVRTAWVLLGTVAAITALSVAAAVAGVGSGRFDLESDEGVRAVLHVAGSGAIFVLMLGVIITAGEYRQNTAVDTFLTTPRRSRVLTAKLVTALSAGVVFGGVATSVAIATASLAYHFKGLTLPLGTGLAWQILFGAVVYAALFGGLGASIGSLIRNQVVAIIGTIAVIIVAEPMVFVISPTVGRWLPAALGRAVVSDPGGDFLEPTTAGIMLFLYVAVIMAFASRIERRRDA
jgi:ABC-type transport system involved in multi-copper enzyme maturation permease subunit